MDATIIRPWCVSDREAVIALILEIQRGEYGIEITRAQQPDLEDVPGTYRRGDGEFWVAETAGRVVGTIALIDFGPDAPGRREGAIRKMFVAADARGRERGIAKRLLERLIGHARAQGFAALTLGTIERFAAALRFYEREGFAPLAAEALPAGFPRMAVDNRFFRLELSAAGTAAASPPAAAEPLG